MKNKAVFLDRDETINYSVLNPNTGEYEAPHIVEDLKLFPFTINSLKDIQEMGFYLFLISNQPDATKGKTTLKNLLDIQDKFHRILIENN